MASCWNVSSLLRLSHLCAVLSLGASSPGGFKGYRAVGSGRCWLRMIVVANCATTMEQYRYKKKRLKTSTENNQTQKSR